MSHPARQRRVLVSLAEGGQQTPIVVVAAEGAADRYVVIDGYKRARRRSNWAHQIPPALVEKLQDLLPVRLGFLRSMQFRHGGGVERRT